MKDEEWYWNERYNFEELNMGIVYKEIGYALTKPSTIYKPKIFIDGDQWCALYGENLQDGVAGFGKSPEKAMADFDISWVQELD